MAKRVPRIKLLIVTEDSSIESEIKAPHVTERMRAAAHALVRVLAGAKPAPEDAELFRCHGD